MKARIGQTGFLNLDRGTRGTPQWKSMLCPFTADNDGEQHSYCGDWCPHFDVEMSGHVIISLCHGTRLTYETCDFADERP